MKKVLFTICILFVVSGCTKTITKNDNPGNIPSLTEKTAIKKIESENKNDNYNYDNWNEFINKKQGYKIKYPNQWIICDGTEYVSNKQRDFLNLPSDEGLVKNCEASKDDSLQYSTILFFSNENSSAYINITIDDRDEEERLKSEKEHADRDLNDVESDIVFSGKKAKQFTDKPNGYLKDIIIHQEDKTYYIYVMKPGIEEIDQTLASFEFIN